MELTHPMKIYKICDARLWKDAEQAGTFHGAGIDINDGYILCLFIDKNILY